MKTGRERELEERVAELERQSALGWDTVFYGLPVALLLDVLDRRGRERREKQRRAAYARFMGWLDGLGEERREEMGRILEAGLPLPPGASGDFVLGFRAHGDVMRSLVREEALHHAVCADDAQELMEEAGLVLDVLSVEWLRGFQAANAALAEAFGPGPAGAGASVTREVVA